MDSDFMIKSLLDVSKQIERFKPKAICVISAHWEQPTPTVLYQKYSSLLFDFYGFPKSSYQLKYPAPCDLGVADRIVKLLKESGHKEVTLDRKRGYDHGVFIPMAIAAPNADIPLVQVSLCSVTGNRRETAMHNLRLGAILGPLRDEGVMIIGSGMAYHSMRGFNEQESKPKNAKFNRWLVDTVTAQSADQSMLDLVNWTDAPNALHCHPREEHLLPLHVCLGSNLGIESMDHMFTKYRQHKKIEDDGKSVKLKCEVQEWSGKIHSYAGFTFF